MELNVHDLVFLQSNEAIRGAEPTPDWVFTDETAKQIAVVRRMQTMDDVVPIGFRGNDRSKRFAAFTSTDNIVKVITPEQAIHGQMPKSHEQTIIHLKRIFQDVRWGIGGSIGFTMATGIQACTEKSDVDVILYVDRLPPHSYLQQLWERLQQLEHRVDVQVEISRIGACLLEELVASDSVLMRTGTGLLLMQTDHLMKMK